MYSRRRILVAALAGAAPSARADVVEGIPFDDITVVANQRLVLNGIGVGQQLTEKVHVAALYLVARQADATAVLAAPGAKRLETVFLRRVSSRALTRFFVNGMRESAESRALMQHIADVARFGELFSSTGERLVGDRVTMDWVPGTGIEVRVNARLLAPVINNEAIYRLLLDVHVGPKANRRLRDGLLASAQAASVPR
jgi:hypothetical protein